MVPRTADLLKALGRLDQAMQAPEWPATLPMLAYAYAGTHIMGVRTSPFQPTDHTDDVPAGLGLLADFWEAGHMDANLAQMGREDPLSADALAGLVLAVEVINCPSGIAPPHPGCFDAVQIIAVDCGGRLYMHQRNEQTGEVAANFTPPGGEQTPVLRGSIVVDLARMLKRMTKFCPPDSTNPQALDDLIIRAAA